MIKPLFNEEICVVRRIVNLGHAVRAKAKVKVRQPLSCVRIGLPEDVSPELVLVQKDVILEELNVKELEFINDVSDVVMRVCTPNARIIGPKYGKDVQKIIQLAKSGEFTVLPDSGVRIGDFILGGDEVEVGYKGMDGFDVESEAGMVVLLDTVITDELKNEGLAREIVRYIQEMRKKAGYNVDDRIFVIVETEDHGVASAITSFADYIKRETLAVELQQGGNFESDLEKSVNLEGVSVKLAVRK